MRNLKALLLVAAALLCCQQACYGKRVKAVQENIWSWTCESNKCIKGPKNGGSVGGQPVEVCKLNCGEYGALWPKPTGKVTLGQGYFSIYPQNVSFVSVSAPDPETDALLQKAILVFRDVLLKTHPDYKNDGVSPFPGGEAGDPIAENELLISIGVTQSERSVRLFGDESYVLSVQRDSEKVGSVTILANTFFGARHGLETLSQLMAYDENEDALKMVDSASIQDKPVYTHRGLSMDTSRNFFSIQSLKKVVDGMSYNKLNMLHWHITDTHSFPFYSKRQPEMSLYGAYSPRKVYTPEEIAEFVEYARVRGVKVIAEFDAPAHVGNGWQWGEAAGKGKMALCVNKEPWAQYCVEPPCGQLNPANENMYQVLGNIYKDLAELFENDMFHMGGDEVKLDCWLESEEITAYLQAQGKNNTQASLIELWGEFQQKAFALFEEARVDKSENLTAILWTSELASVEHVQQFLPKDNYAIQIWTTGDDLVIPFLVRNGYRIILSNYDALYFDCGYGAWIGEGNNWCSPYKGWQKVYSNDIRNILAKHLTQEEIDRAIQNNQLLGGEAAMWSEQVDEQSVGSKLYPRLAALAERLWTNPTNTWFEAETRMVHNRDRLVRRGIDADQLQPEWCHQNEQLCYG